MLEGAEREAFVAEVLRINERFIREVVEAFDICPWARGARAQGRVVREVMLQDDLDPRATLELIRHLEADARPIEVALLIYPRVNAGPRAFEHFNAEVRSRLDALPGPRVFVHAVFHPDFPRDARTPDSLVAFFRKSPDPTIQLVRHSTIESVRGERGRGTVVVDPRMIDFSKLTEAVPPSISERVTRDNYERVAREGPEAIEALYASIREDRARSYARFLSR